MELANRLYRSPPHTPILPGSGASLNNPCIATLWRSTDRISQAFIEDILR